jgi:HEAT repeat protein
VEAIKDPEELAGLLDHPDKDVQMNAAMALASLGAAAVPALITAFASRNKETRATAAEIISSFGTDAVGPLMQALTDTRSDVSCGAASVLGRLGDRRAVPALVAMLQGNGGGTGPAAAEALGYLGDAASVDALIKALTSPDSDLQSGAARALGYIGDERAISSLIEALGSEDFSLRRIAIDALTGMGEASIPNLSEALLHSERGVRSGAAECFAQMGYVPETEQEQINLLVANEEWLEITRRGSSAVDVLVYFVDDANEEVRVGAITALGKVGGPRAAGTLAGLLADNDPLVRRKAMGLLAGMGRDAVPALLKVRVSAASPAQLQAANQLLERLEGAAHPGATPR